MLAMQLERPTRRAAEVRIVRERGREKIKIKRKRKREGGGSSMPLKL